MRATVRYVTGNTRHFVAGRLVTDIAAVEIVPDEEAYLLLYFDSRGTLITDGWHQDVRSAMEQATFEFGIQEEDWTRCDEPPGSSSDAPSS